MSYYAYDVNGYVGDAASIGGWDAFRAWANGRGGEIEKLVRSGYTSAPNALVAELSRGSSNDASADSVRANIAQLASKASGLLIITDGEQAA